MKKLLEWWADRGEWIDPIVQYRFFRHAWPFAIFGVIVCAITAPLFGEGYLFFTDMVWGPNMSIDQQLSAGLHSSFPLMAGILFFAQFVPIFVLQQLVIFGTLFCIPVGMYVLARLRSTRAMSTVSGILYLCNPFVLERFLVGHWLVLLGYAFLPVMIRFVLLFLSNPTGRSFVGAVSVVVYFPWISQHFAYIGYLMLPIVVFFALLLRGKLWWLKTAKSFGAFIVLGVAFLVVNAFWLFSLFGVGGKYEAFSLADFRAFATQPDPVYGVYVNVLALYGFWREGIEVLPKDITDFWWMIPLIIILLSCLGIVRAISRRDPLASALSVIFPIAFILSIGFATPWTESLTTKFVEIIPGFRGLRETGKVIGVIAFTYALYAPVGVRVLARLIAQAWEDFAQRRRVMKRVIRIQLVILGCLGCLSVSTMFSGNMGIFQATPYPEDWQVAREFLKSDHARGSTLVLPWHMYLVFPWAGSLPIANPADLVFPPPIISSTYLGNAYLENERFDPWDEVLFSLLQDDSKRDEAIQALRAHGVTHVVLYRASDSHRYLFLNDERTFSKVMEGKTLILYRVIE